MCAFVNMAGKVKVIWIFITALAVSALWLAYMKKKLPYQEHMTGFGVTTGLAFNNRTAYCQPGNESEGGSWSGGCFIPHRVIV